MFQRLNSGAERSVTLRANIRAFEEVSFRTRSAAASPHRTIATTVLGREVALPVLLAPVGALRLQHPDGVLAAVEASTEVGTVCAISPAAGNTMEEIAIPAGGNLWYQVSTGMSGQPGAEKTIDQARQRGYAAIVVTVDSVLRPRAEPIRIDVRNAIEFAPDLVRHPRWTYQFVRDGMRVSVANTAIGAGPPSAGRSVCWDDFEWIVKRWAGPVVIKGVTTAEDARRAVDAGAAAIVVSNHGGLILDGATATLRALPEVLDAVGDRAEVLVDGGVRSGGDVVKALAMGARAVLIGRSYVMGLAVGGATGVRRILEILSEDIDRSLAFLGCATVQELTGSHVNVPWSQRGGVGQQLR
jgi:isopentenyl diphosphate isomerase/L-lactate dehydrogenase-like FMN-dependent dehydrogenase